MNEQEKYWEFLKQVRFELSYIDEYIRSTNRPETTMNVVMAIASSGSIASWVIWRDLGFVWGVIIAGSQLINAVRPLLPYTRRLKLLQAMHGELAKLSLEIEYHWFGISHGDFTEREINGKLFEMKRKREDIDSRHLAGHVLPKRPRLEALANASVDQYLFKNYVGGTE